MSGSLKEKELFDLPEAARCFSIGCLIAMLSALFLNELEYSPFVKSKFTLPLLTESFTFCDMLPELGTAVPVLLIKLLLRLRINRL